jgi:predicted small lipoprotein YifL
LRGAHDGGRVRAMQKLWVAGLFLLAACGIKGPPRPPLESVAPPAPLVAPPDAGCCTEAR